MSAFLAIFSLILVLFGGWGLGYLLFGSRQSVCDQAIHSWLIGTFYVSALLGLFGILLSGESLVAGVTLAMVIPGILALRKRLRTGAVSFAFPWPKGIWEWLLCAVLLVGRGGVALMREAAPELGSKTEARMRFNLLQPRKGSLGCDGPVEGNVDFDRVEILREK